MHKLALLFVQFDLNASSLYQLKMLKLYLAPVGTSFNFYKVYLKSI